MFNSFAYRHSPVRVQESLIAVRSSLRNLMRESRSCQALVAQLQGSQWWSTEELQAFQGRRLYQVLEAAMRDVPFYRQKNPGCGPGSGELPAAQILAGLPVLTKADVRAAGIAMVSRKKNVPLFAGSTSGTTGAPLRLYQDLNAINRENAFVWRQLAWAGLRPGGRRAWMRGDMIVPATQTRAPFWRLNRVDNMLMCSSYHLSESTAAQYVRALGDFDPAVIQAYPSSIGFLAQWMRSAGVQYRGRSLRGIVTSSETLSDDSRREIERVFGCRVFDWYGQFERIAAIGTCEQGSHHLLSDYSFVEMLPVGDGLYELVGTGFNNFSMPLIRYRCGDLVRPAPATQRCACGRSFPVIEQIFGRIDDAVKLTDGRSIGRLDHIFKDVAGVLEAQIRQDRLDAVTILVVPAADFGEHARTRLHDNARQRLGNSTAVEIHLVDAIARTANGKLKGVVCNV